MRDYCGIGAMVVGFCFHDLGLLVLAVYMDSSVAQAFDKCTRFANCYFTCPLRGHFTIDIGLVHQGVLLFLLGVKNEAI